MVDQRNAGGTGVNLGGLRIGRLAPADASALLSSAESASLTYDHVGSTLPGGDGGEHPRTHSVVTGRGDDVFARTKDAVRTWVPQRGIGAQVIPGDPVADGLTLLVVLRVGPFFVVAPNRVVRVVDEARRYGFGYGTLPGHAERGEESFLVEHLDDDTVRLTITVDARPATALARAATPIVMLLQRSALRGYLRAVARHAEQP